jgi:ribonuclease HI
LEAWYDSSFIEKPRLAVLGICIENDDRKLVYHNTIVRTDITKNSDAEICALIELLNVIKKNYQYKNFKIYGDEQSTVKVVKDEENYESSLINESRKLICECGLDLNVLNWVERDLNKADKYTCIGQHTGRERRYLFDSIEDIPSYSLLRETYNEYIQNTKGNSNLTLEEAQLKLNRNIQRAINNDIILSDGTIVYFYFGLQIFVKNEVIVKINNKGANTLPMMYYRENIHLLEEAF